MNQEEFSCYDSTIHRLDPRVRIVVATAFSFLIGLSQHFPVLFFCWVLTMGLAAQARILGISLLKRVFRLNKLILLFWFVLPLTVKGDVIAVLGPIQINAPGILLALRLTIKMNAILLAFTALVVTCPVSTIGHGLNRLGVPDKIVLLLFLTYRYIFVIQEEYQRLLTAAKLRCFQAKTNLHTYKTYGYLFGMLLVRSSLRAERVHHAMICRGFDGTFYSLNIFQLKPRDIVWGLLMGLLLVGLIGTELWQHL